MGVSPHTILLEMAEVRQVVSTALEARASKGLKVRQPLAKLSIAETSWKKNTEIYQAIIAEEVNVHAVVLDGSIAPGDVVLDVVITPELKMEGDMRDLVRTIQDMRKKAGLNPDDRIMLTLPKEQMELLKKFESEILPTVGATKVTEATELKITKV